MKKIIATFVLLLALMAIPVGYMAWDNQGAIRITVLQGKYTILRYQGNTYIIGHPTRDYSHILSYLDSQGISQATAFITSRPPHRTQGQHLRQLYQRVAGVYTSGREFANMTWEHPMPPITHIRHSVNANGTNAHIIFEMAAGTIVAYANRTRVVLDGHVFYAESEIVNIYWDPLSGLGMTYTVDVVYVDGDKWYLDDGDVGIVIGRRGVRVRQSIRHPELDSGSS